ncbi:SHOCT domain-containing protein [Hazenella coriacea]|uniref:Putative membrane protein n=1 Tax=Hazenella coriacea TaxID=1179467 RepID=A0A4R3L9C5_9BACL|nr:SHOCT domain-containing protein [Hazenella coriacea]TCS94824.1 putative membrane protein [Hazenella coriacea]
MMHYGFGGFGMFLWMILQWGILLGGIYLIIRWVRAESPHSKKKEKAIEIIRERYAKGELSEEEYLKMHDILSKGMDHEK